jgi:hypothetical protein
MNKKYFLFPIGIGIIITLLLLFCEDETGKPKVVSKLPEGFVPLRKFDHDGFVPDKHADGILKITFWDEPENASFCFKEEAKEWPYDIIFYTSISDSNYFVEYKNVLYINEAKYIKLEEVAAHALEQRQRIYNLGDEVDMLGAGETVYKVKIISVKAVKTEPYFTDSIITYNIKYASTYNITEKEKEVGGSFIRIKTKNGIECVPDFIDREIAIVGIRTWGKDDEIEAIILRSPEYIGLEYRINLEMLKGKLKTIYFNWNCLDEFREYCNKRKIFIYRRTLNVFDTIIHDCNCYDSLVVEDINLNIRIGDTAGFPGRCLDGRITSSGWLLTDTDTLCWACSSFFLKKGKDYYDAIVNTAFSLRFKDILNSVEDSLRGEKRNRRKK